MSEGDDLLPPPSTPLRRGWTTGACATAAAKAAYTALLTGTFPDPIQIRLPKGQEPAFALTHHQQGDGWAEAAITKDAGDDPDVTHGALIIVRVEPAPAGTGILFKAGKGVGVVTREGLPIPVGEPSITPVPRQMMDQALTEVANQHQTQADLIVTISIPGGEEMAQKTLNPRLGIVGGLSILGTTGIVIPYSCSSWIHSIYRGIDVARAAGLTHLLAATGNTSEAAGNKLLALSDMALIDMGDFAGGMLKYLKNHPVECMTIAGGFAKLTKLAQGHLDLHSSRSQVDLAFLQQQIVQIGGDPTLVEGARSAAEVLKRCETPDRLADALACQAQAQAQAMVSEQTRIEIMIFDRLGTLLTRTDR